MGMMGMVSIDREVRLGWNYAQQQKGMLDLVVRRIVYSSLGQRSFAGLSIFLSSGDDRA